MGTLADFINRNFIYGIVNDTSYSHVDMLTYVLLLFAGVYAVLKILDKLKIKVDEKFVIFTIPYIFMGSVFRVIEDAELLVPPFQYFFITPLIFLVVFAITFSILLLTRYLQKKRWIKDSLQVYAASGIVISTAGVIILVLSSFNNFEPGILVYSLVPAVALTLLAQWMSRVYGMAYMQKPIYSFTIFSFLLDSITTYIGTDFLGYSNKHPFSSILSSLFGTGIVMIPLSLILVILIIRILEKDYRNAGNEDEKYILILTLIVLGFSMGARNLLAITFGV